MYKIKHPENFSKRIKALRANQTDAEAFLWHLLRDKQMFDKKFRRQHPFPPYIVDFYCHEAKLVIELDGGQHTTGDAKIYDADRTLFLEAQGLKVIRFWNNEVVSKTEVVLENIVEYLEIQIPHPNLLPKGEGTEPLLEPSPLGRGQGEGKPQAVTITVSTKKAKTILAIESSCDDTAVAVVRNGRTVLASVLDSQTALHQPYGGVIPELAARHHLTCIHGLIETCLSQANMKLTEIDAVAATVGPGLIGSLLVGASVAKTLSLLTEKPFLAVHHLYAHVASNYLESDLAPPFLCLLVSGGHTQLIHVKSYAEMVIVGETLDDAVGEAYDKVARVMGLGYPGGPILDKLAQQGGGNPKAIALPTPKTQNSWDFSFSGLKTAFVRKWEAETGELQTIPKQLQADFAASFQATAVNTLVKKTVACAEALGLKTVSVAGGVSANSALRGAFLALQNEGYTVHIPKMGYCTDNAAMVGASAFFNPLAEGDLGMDVFSRVSIV